LCGFFFFLLFEIFQTNNSLKIDKIQTKNQSFFEIFQRNNFLKQRNIFLKSRKKATVWAAFLFLLFK
jgi:hypothetical protein